ncbi:hypothetical protein HBA54_00030 [Pelagibius litoralis]|uniref:Uncharacterized protein n=1 Tax=Pelagibius litoralis TaxID=374515 RepID=A0A967C9Z0_9PROT|nr:hypothetical protein [Pelagibius litoralis]NIA66974.1 hypothetical protein [Pelagibius litoralis]
MNIRFPSRLVLPVCQVVLGAALLLTPLHDIHASEAQTDAVREQIKAAYIGWHRGELKEALQILEPLVQAKNREAIFLKAGVLNMMERPDGKKVLALQTEAARLGFVAAYLPAAGGYMNLGNHELAFAWALKAAKEGVTGSHFFISAFYCDSWDVILPDSLVADAWLIIGMGGSFDADDQQWVSRSCGPSEPDDFRRGQLETQVKFLTSRFRLPPVSDPLADWYSWTLEALEREVDTPAE